ncbi:MAG: Luciferase-like, partial [uncultured Thermomicrobiales bacterium]
DPTPTLAALHPRPHPDPGGLFDRRRPARGGRAGHPRRPPRLRTGLVRRAPQLPRARQRCPGDHDRPHRGANHGDPGRRRRRHAAQPRPAQDRRDVPPARGAPPRPDRPRSRPRPRHRHPDRLRDAPLPGGALGRQLPRVARRADRVRRRRLPGRPPVPGDPAGAGRHHAAAPLAARFERIQRPPRRRGRVGLRLRRPHQRARRGRRTARLPGVVRPLRALPGAAGDPDRLGHGRGDAGPRPGALARQRPAAAPPPDRPTRRLPLPRRGEALPVHGGRAGADRLDADALPGRRRGRGPPADRRPRRPGRGRRSDGHDLPGRAGGSPTDGRLVSRGIRAGRAPGRTDPGRRRFGRGL